MSDELRWPEDEDESKPKRHKDPTNGQVIFCTLLVVGVVMVVLWVFAPNLSPSNNARSRGAALTPPGYYGQTRAVEATPANIYEAGVVRSVLNFESGVLVEVVVDSGRSRPSIVWVVAEGELRPGDECVLKFVDGINYRERHAFKIETGKKK